MKIISYIYDFLSLVFEKEELKKAVKEIILFGSVAKGVFDKKSDIDLFFNMDKAQEEKSEKLIREALKSFQIKAEKTWHLKNIDYPINLIVGDLNDETWDNLRDEIASGGIILYGNYKKIPDKLNQKYLFYYSLNNLQRKSKMRFIRKMFGYTIRTKNKKYQQKGITDEINGLKLASNVILADSKDILKIKELFREFKIKYKIIETWVRL